MIKILSEKAGQTSTKLAGKGKILARLQKILSYHQNFNLIPKILAEITKYLETHP